MLQYSIIKLQQVPSPPSLVKWLTGIGLRRPAISVPFVTGINLSKLLALAVMPSPIRQLRVRFFISFQRETLPAGSVKPRLKKGNRRVVSEPSNMRSTSHWLSFATPQLFSLPALTKVPSKKSPPGLICSAASPSPSFRDANCITVPSRTEGWVIFFHPRLKQPSSAELIFLSSFCFGSRRKAHPWRRHSQVSTDFSFSSVLSDWHGKNNRNSHSRVFWIQTPAVTPVSEEIQCSYEDDKTYALWCSALDSAANTVVLLLQRQAPDFGGWAARSSVGSRNFSCD